MITINNPPQGIQLTSAIGDIEILADDDSVYVVLMNAAAYTGAADNKVLLQETYYAYDGKVTLHNIAELLEDDMRDTGLAYSDFYLLVFPNEEEYDNQNEDDQVTLTVLYCDRLAVCSSVDTFLSENFLTTMQTRRIAPDGNIKLAFFAAKGDSTQYKITFTYQTRSQSATQSYTLTSNAGNTASKNSIVLIERNVQTLFEQLCEDNDLATADVKLLSITIYSDQRSATYYLDYALRMRNAFVFRNCFNVDEEVTFSAVTTAKTDVDREEAVINGSTQFYDQTVTKTYEVETAALTSYECNFIDQLLTSQEVYRYVYDPTASTYTTVPILITDCTCEVQDGDEELNTVKLTWRFADNRPIVSMAGSANIFDQNYNIVYS